MSSVSIGKSESAASARSEAQSAQRLDDVPLSVGRQFTLVSTLAAYSVMLLVGITHHEPWADEAQAWLLSRDLGYRYLVFHQLAYEGAPPLWPTILWVANHWFHLPYQAMGWIGGLCALAGCWFFARYSPFPAVIRVLLPFTYFVAFQYAIVARPYVLLPLCAFAAAHFFRHADSRPWRFVAAASALALLCAPGVMIALGLVAARVWYALRKWNSVPLHARRRLIGAATAFCIVIALVAVVNWPPADRTVGRFDRPASAGDSAANYGIGALPDEIAVGFFGARIPSVAFLLVVGAWCACRRRLLPFAFPTALLLVFWVKVYGSLWHCGALTMIAAAALWIAWPCKERAYPRLEGALNALVLLGLAGLFTVQTYWTASTLAMDYSRPYSGSLDAANFLRAVGADATSTCGFGFHSVAVQPYFRQRVFQNWPQGESFWRGELGNRVDQNCNGPKWVVLPKSGPLHGSEERFYQQALSLRSLGYAPVHHSRGSLFFEGREAEPTDFIIYRLQTN